MTFPLVILAVASVVAGGLGIFEFVSRQYFVTPDRFSILAWTANSAHHALGSVENGFLAGLFEPFHHALVPALCGLGAVLFGFLAAWGLYAGAPLDPLPARIPSLSRAMRNKFYFDELYGWVIALTQDAMATFADLFDTRIVAGCVRLVQGGTELCGRGLRLVQTGNLQTYAFLLAAGAAVALYFMFRN
jgi:NADH-quinone oxidoreductase subunit L